ncbi:MAG TPA: hypothetical protein PKM69_03290 [Bacteroidales bacterium]|mgnify:CR=1 FL=1|nr:hypothetical protein [Bacteroidales bacterium]
MNSILNRVTLLFILISFSSFVFSQTAEKKSTGIKYSEEILVTTDRDIYIAGERVYMKIYKLNGITRTPGNISQVVYSDMVDNYNNPIVQIKAGIQDFSGAAEFVIPDTLRTGNYLIRTYTNWMHNFSEALFSYKRISVINPFESLNSIKIPVKGSLPDSVAFFPEGGKLIYGIENLVGIRCFNNDGIPLGVNGLIVSSNNDTLCRVDVTNGTGFFTIRPAGIERLFLVARSDNGSVRRYILPPVDESGISLEVRNSRSKGQLMLYIRQNSHFNASGKIYVVYSPVLTDPLRKEINIGEDLVLKKDTLPAGLARITITDNNGNTFANRWVYNDKGGNIDFNVRITEPVRGERSLVKAEINALSSDGKPLKSDIVVSVVKSFTVDSSNAGNIPGFRQIPYLASMSTNMEQFDINDYLIFYPEPDDFIKHQTTHDDLFLPELAGQLVSGALINNATGEPLRNENVILSFIGKSARCKFTKTDSMGKFNFVTDEYGTKEIVIEPMQAGLRDYSVEIGTPFMDAMTRYKAAPFYPDTTRLADINKAVISMQVKGIYDPFVNAGINLPESRAGHDFYDKPVETIVLSNYIELTSMREVIKELIPGLMIYRKDGRSYFRMVNESQNPMFETPPMVLVDGVVFDDVDRILAMNPRDIEKIEVLRSRYFISDIVIEGIVNFVTQKGNLSVLEFDRSLFRQEYQAMQLPFRFYSPGYSVDSVRNGRIPDYRNTLYWNPDLRTDEDGRAEVEFYTSDERGEYLIIMEGVTADGKTGRSELKFVVGDKK